MTRENKRIVALTSSYVCRSLSASVTFVTLVCHDRLIKGSERVWRAFSADPLRLVLVGAVTRRIQGARTTDTGGQVAEWEPAPGLSQGSEEDRRRPVQPVRMFAQARGGRVLNVKTMLWA